MRLGNHFVAYHIKHCTASGSKHKRHHICKHTRQHAPGQNGNNAQQRNRKRYAHDPHDRQSNCEKRRDHHYGLRYVLQRDRSRHSNGVTHIAGGETCAGSQPFRNFVKRYRSHKKKGLLHGSTRLMQLGADARYSMQMRHDPVEDAGESGSAECPRHGKKDCAAGAAECRSHETKRRSRKHYPCGKPENDIVEPMRNALYEQSQNNAGHDRTANGGKYRQYHRNSHFRNPFSKIRACCNPKTTPTTPEPCQSIDPCRNT